MKRIILLSYLLLNLSLSHAQNFVWAKSMGGANGQVGYSIATDALGNVYTCGYFKGTADFDPGPGTYTLSVTSLSASVYVSKLDAAGNFVWAKQLSTVNSNTDIPTDIFVDASTNIYVCCYTSSSSTCLNKLDAYGNQIWSKNFGAYCFPRSIVVDASGNVFTLGDFEGINDFDPSPATFTLNGGTSSDVFINKLDAAGNFVWTKKIGGNYFNEGWALTVDAPGNVYITGDFHDVADFDPGPLTYTMSSGSGPWFRPESYICKLDPSGNFVWAKQIVTNSGTTGFGICVDFSGNVYTTGHFGGTSDFDPGSGVYNLTSFSVWETYISKLDPLGNFVWAKQIAGTDYSRGVSIRTDAVNNVYISGFMFGTSDFDPGVGVYNLTANGAEDAFISKLDASGNFICVQLMGGAGYDKSFDVLVDQSGNIYTTGCFRSPTADFDPGIGTYNMNSLGDYDIFVTKLNGCSSPLSTSELEKDNSLFIFPNPTTGSFKIDYSDLRYTDVTLTLRNALGELVYSSEFKNSDGFINADLSNYPKGIYIIELRNGNEYIRKKVVLQ